MSVQSLGMLPNDEDFFFSIILPKAVVNRAMVAFYKSN